jgi:cytochrome b subunit of formate dehydrogenase
MTNVLHWIGVALGLLVAISGIRLFLRGLSLKPSDPKTRIRAKWGP